MSALQPNNHEEADTRLFLHVADAVYSGHKSVLIRTTYINVVNVVVIAVQVITHMKNKIDELWIAFGSGRNFRYIPVHTTAAI